MTHARVIHLENIKDVAEVLAENSAGHRRSGAGAGRTRSAVVIDEPVARPPVRTF